MSKKEAQHCKRFLEGLPTETLIQELSDVYECSEEEAKGYIDDFIEYAGTYLSAEDFDMSVISNALSRNPDLIKLCKEELSDEWEKENNERISSEKNELDQIRAEAEMTKNEIQAYDWEVVDDDAEYTGFHGNNKSDKNVDDDKINRTAFTYKPPSREQVIKYIKLIIVLSLAVIVVGGGVSIWNIYQDFKNSIEIGISSEYALGQDYKAVVRTLKENGFTDIHEQPVYDLSYDEIDEENKVSRIEIKGKSKFDKDEKVPNNARVDVIYHVLKNIKLPISAKEAKKMNYEDLVSVLKKAGFVNIRVDKNTDLITGWITKDGSVESMSVDGDAKFSNDSEYRPDAKIVIVYHTFKD